MLLLLLLLLFVWENEIIIVIVINKECLGQEGIDFQTCRFPGFQTSRLPDHHATWEMICPTAT